MTICVSIFVGFTMSSKDEDLARNEQLRTPTERNKRYCLGPDGTVSVGAREDITDHRVDCQGVAGQ